MAGDDGFKHIKVTPAEEGDVVVYAGIGKPQSEPAADELSPDASDPGRSESFERSSARGSGSKAEELLESARKIGDSDKQGQSLDDLDAGPMPIRQKIVIIAAIVLILIAVVYYFAVIR